MKLQGRASRVLPGWGGVGSQWQRLSQAEKCEGVRARPGLGTDKVKVMEKPQTRALPGAMGAMESCRVKEGHSQV